VEKFVEGYDHIFEHSYRKIAEIDGVRCLVEVLDTAGQEEYTALRDQWIRDGEGFVILYGIGNRSSFTRAQRFHSQIARVKQSADSFEIQLGQISQRKTPIILVGHNYAKGSGQVDREVSAAEGLSLSRELECDFMEVSAKNGTNVKKVIIDLVRMIRRQREAAMGARLQLQPIME
jgi:GTPase KRas protein